MWDFARCRGYQGMLETRDKARPMLSHRIKREEWQVPKYELKVTGKWIGTWTALISGRSEQGDGKGIIECEQDALYFHSTTFLKECVPHTLNASQSGDTAPWCISTERYMLNPSEISSARSSAMLREFENANVNWPETQRLAPSYMVLRSNIPFHFRQIHQTDSLVLLRNFGLQDVPWMFGGEQPPDK